MQNTHTAPDPDSNKAHSTTTPRKPSRGWLRTLLVAVGLCALALLLPVWLLGSQAGTRWLLGHVPGLHVTQPQGSLLGDFRAAQLRYELPAQGGSVQIDAPQWQQLRLQWDASQRFWARLTLRQLSAERVQLHLRASTEPSAPLRDLRLPLGLQVHALHIKQLVLSPQGPTLQDIKAELDLSTEAAQAHRLTLQQLRYETVQLSGQARMGTAAPMPLNSHWVLNGQHGDMPAWQLDTQIQGPLHQLALQGQLKAAAQALQLQATLTPLADFPLQQLHASAQALDLHALLAALPRTALHGTLDVLEKSRQLQLRAALDNRASGRLDEGRAPLRQLRLHAGIDRQDWSRLELHELLLTLHGGGQLSASGKSQQKDGAHLELTLRELDTQQLHQAWPRLQAQGRITLHSRSAWNSATPPTALQISAELNGQWLLPQHPATALALALQAELSPQLLAARQLRVSSGSASLEGQATLRLAQALKLGEGWQLDSQLQLKGLDPLQLWASAGSPTRANELNGNINAQLQQLPQQAWPQGQVELNLQASRWANTALSGELRYARAAGSAPPQLQLQALLGDARLSANTLPAPPETDPRRQTLSLAVALNAPRLASLQALLPPSLARAQLQGQAQLQGEVSLQPAQGSSPLALHSRGTAELNALQLKGIPEAKTSLAKANASWLLNSATAAPLQVQLQMQQLRHPQLRLQQAQLQLQGSWAAHQLTLQSNALLPLPALLDDTHGPRPLPRPEGLHPTELRLQLQGALSAAPWLAWQQGGSWQLQELQFLARPAEPEPAPWIKLASGGAQLQFLADGQGLQSLRLQPGRMEVLDAALRWDQAQWQGEADWALQAQLEPLRVAPLLARLQPHFGWGGDLLMQGQLKASASAQGISVDAVLQRMQGDLSVTDELNTQSLGLSDLRLGLLAQDGRWHITQGLAGRSLGALGGAITLLADNPHALPGPKAPLQGVMQLQVQQLAQWGFFFPAPWRASGTLQAALSLSGTLQSPEVTGQAQGQDLALRQPLMGVDMQQGSFALQLNGSHAQLQHFSARAGQGSLTLMGPISFGAQPKAELLLKAERFALLQRVDRQLVTSGQAQLTLGPRGLKLHGHVGIDQGLFDFSAGDAPKLDEDVHIVRHDAPPTPNAPRDADSIDLQLSIQLGEQLRLIGYGLDTRLTGSLQLAQHNGHAPTLHGEVKTANGLFSAYGQKLKVNRGVLSFVGPYDNPRLDVLALRPGLENEELSVGVTITGSANNPRIRLYSDPQLSDTAKLSWLVLGRGPDELGRGDTLLLQRAAMALLSGSGPSASDNLLQRIGIDELSFSNRGEDASTTVVRLGKQITKNLYLGYERGLNTTTGNWQLIYKLAQRFTLRAQAGDSQGLDLIWQWKWE
ncbi:translocation/assembly module TamB domain-containing protein [Roseateles sp. BYS180W]|uniref:Translocation/assembly module TamB domain-containing protein n=1 Tax=Roseateles rivi TaxID=3299028 RepID=A0ABW7FRX7_9BURK